MSKRILTVILLMAVLVFSGCGQVTPKLSEMGKVVLTISIPGATPSEVELQTVKPALSKVKFEGTHTASGAKRSVESDITGGVAKLEIENLTAGTWTITVSALDTNGNSAYKATDSLKILGGQTVNRSLSLLPQSVDVKIDVDLADLINTGWSIDKVELIYYSISTDGSIVKPSTGSYFVTTVPVDTLTKHAIFNKTFSAGTLYYKLTVTAVSGYTLYNDSNWVNESIWPGDKPTISIVPPNVPIAGNVNLNPIIKYAAAPPTNVTATLVGSQIVFTFTESPDKDISGWEGYTIFCKESDKSNFASYTSLGYITASGGGVTLTPLLAGFKSFDVALSSTVSGTYGPLSNSSRILQ